MTAYLDNSATTQPCARVIEAMTQCMREGFYNPSSLYAPAMEPEKRMNECRMRIMKELHAPQGGSVIFTSGGTECNNLAILGYVRTLHSCAHLMVSRVEHPSVLEAFYECEKAGHRVTYFPVDEKGQIVWDEFEKALTPDTALVSCMQVNNETGAITDYARLSALVRSHCSKAVLHTDCVQGFMRVPFDANLTDMVTVSAHKLRGPKGVGALWVRKGVRLLPRHIGGGQENGLRSGTENTYGIAGLLAAMEDLHMDGSLQEMKCAFAQKILDAIPGAVVNGPDPRDGAPHIVNIALPSVRAEVMLHALEAENIYCSTGSACSSKKRRLSPVLLAMGVKPDVAEGALRFSFSQDTTWEMLEYAADTMIRIWQTLSKYRRR